MTKANGGKDVFQVVNDMDRRLRNVERRSKYDDENDTAPLPPSVTMSFGVREAKNHLEFKAIIKWGTISPNTCQADVDYWVVETKPVTSGGADVDPSGQSGGNNDTSLLRHKKVHNKGEDNPHWVYHVEKPKTWYWTSRVRIVDKAHRAGPWSAWTTPALPWTGADPKPPAPSYGGTPITFDNKDKGRNRKVRLLFTFDEVVNWDVPGGDHEDDMAGYIVQLDRSDDGITWDGSPYREVHKRAKDADTDTTRVAIFEVRRRHWYRCRVRTVDRYGRHGDWSSWTSGALPFDNNNPPAPTNVETWDLNTDRVPIRWDDPLIDVETRGTSAVTNGSTAVTGTGTKYTVEVREGSVIRFAGSANTYTVKTVSSDTALVLMSAYGEATNAARKLYLQEDDPDVSYYEWQIAKASQVTNGTPDVFNAIYDKGRTKGNFVNVKVQPGDVSNRFRARVRSIDAASNRSPWISAWIRANHGGLANNSTTTGGDDGAIGTPITTDSAAPASSPAATVVVSNLAKSLFISWPAISNSDPVTYDLYRHTVSGFTPPGTGTLVYSGPSISFLDQNLAAGTTYYYRVIARDQDGSAAPGTQGSNVPLAYGSDRTAPASSPAATVVIPNAKGTAVITWTPISNADTVTYEVWRHTVTGFTPPGTGTLVAAVDGTQVTDTNLTGGTTYYYRIIAKDVDGAAAPGTQGSGTAKTYASDGSAPSTSPTPVVRGGVGFLYVEWDAITNTDPVTYEVHISTTSGFTPGPTTLSAEIQGTMCFIRAMPDGTPLAYTLSPGVAKVYYVKIKAKDQDGAGPNGTQVSGQMAPATSPDIAAGAITASQIQAGALSTQYLGAVNSLISSLIAGNPTSQHVEIDAAGLRVKGTSGELLVNLPTDPSLRPTFNGDLIAQNLEVIGATFLGDTTIAKGTDVTLQSSIQPPSTAPSVDIDYPSSIQFNTAGTVEHKDWFCLAYTATGGAAGTTPSYYVSRQSPQGYWRYIEEYRASDGQFIRNIQLPDNSDDCWGIVAIGTNVYILHQRWDSMQFYIRKYAMADFTNDAGALNVSSEVTSNKPGLGTDGTDLYMVCGSSQIANANLRTVRYTTALVLGVNVTHTALTFDVKEQGGDQTTEWGGLVKVGSTWYLAAYSYDGATLVRRGIYAFTGTITTANGLSRNADEDFNGAGGAEVDGITYDGSNFYTIIDGENITKHTGWTWTSADSPMYWVGYTWYDNAGTTHETTISPRASLTFRKRAAMTISMNPTLPGAGGVDDPNQRRIYINRGATEPQSGGRFNGLLQTAVSTGSAQLLTFNAAGAQEPASNNFGSSTPAAILDSSATGMAFAAGGTFVLPHFARLARPASPVIGQTMVDDTTGLPFAWDGAAWVPLSPIGRHLGSNWQIDADDFMAGAAAAGFAGAWTPLNSGTGSGASNVTSVASHPGIWSLDTGTTASGRCAVATGAGGILLGSGRVRVGCWLRTAANLSDTTDRYRVFFGLMDTNVEANIVDAVYFRYSDNLNTGKWGARVLNDGVAATLLDSGVTVAVSTWYFLEIEVNDDASVATFYVNKTSIGTVSGAGVLPSGAGDEVRIVAGIEKILGTASRPVWLDEIFAFGELTTIR